MQSAALLTSPDRQHQKTSLSPQWFRQHWGLLLWGLLLLGVNLPLWHGGVNGGLLFLPAAAMHGQWWRWLTFPLVHLSWYHLLLDGGAFLLLYHGLQEKGRLKRTLILAMCSAGSLLMGLWRGEVNANGLSGMSSIAHGLMAFSALEMIRDTNQRTWGLASLAMVAAKSLYELISGKVAFEFMHMGLCGQPEAACHAGGVLGGLAAFALICLCRRRLS